MAEVEEECQFETRADQVQFLTRTNGDKITINFGGQQHLSQAQATSMAWLVNADDQAILEFQVKVKET